MTLKCMIANNINSVHIVMCIVGAISCLLPLYFDDSYIENFELSKSLDTTEFVVFSAVCFALAAPLILDQFIELFMNTRNETNKHSKSIIKVLFATDVEQTIFIFGTLIVPIIALIPNEWFHYQNMAFSYVCCVKSQYTVSFPFECCP
jgi:hypothetical protein